MLIIFSGYLLNIYLGVDTNQVPIVGSESRFRSIRKVPKTGSDKGSDKLFYRIKVPINGTD